MSEPDVSKLLTVEQAIEIIDAAEVHPREIELPLEEAAEMRLAQDILADRDYPPFDKSLMDGFAIVCGDEAELEVVGEIPAGVWPTHKIVRGQTMAIMTGAPMPQGADGVVPVEDVKHHTPSPRYSGERAGERGKVRAESDERSTSDTARPSPQPSPPSTGEREKIHILRATSPGRFIAKQGSDVRAGNIVLKRGMLLGPAQLAVAASVGAAKVKVFASPRVAVLGTGDELVPVAAKPQAAQIRNSNSLMLVALLRRMKCDVRDAGVARDHPQKIRDAIVSALKNVHALFITGGMSMGEHDYVPRILLDLGVDLRITKLRIKPGKPFLFGVHQNKFIFGLPGNPVSGFACVVRLASRLLARLGGGVPSENWITVNLTTSLEANGPREFYQPAILDERGATPLQWKGSADIYTLAAANALLVRPENDPPRSIGDSVKILPLNYA